MASTIPSINSSRLGCVSDEIAAKQALAGDRDALMANTIVAVADAARTDITALQAAGGGGPYYPASLYLADYVASGASLLGATATTTSIASHTLTLTGTHSRTIILTLSSSANSYVGPYTVTGTIGGAAQTEDITVVSGGGAAYQTVKTYDPGTITLSRPAQGNTSGSYTVTVGDGFGLAVEAFEGPEALYYGGHLLSITAAGGTSAAIATSGIVGPTAAPPHGKLQLEAGALAGFGTDPLAACYMAVV